MIVRVIVQFVVFVLFARVLTALSLWIVARATRPLERRVAVRVERAPHVRAELSRTGRTLSRSS
jgi:hypothetical protein